MDQYSVYTNVLKNMYTAQLAVNSKITSFEFTKLIIVTLPWQANENVDIKLDLTVRIFNKYLWN